MHGLSSRARLAARLVLLLSVFALVGLFSIAAPAWGAKTVVGGKLMVDGRHVFLKTACPLADFAQNDLRSTVDVLLGKGYNNIKINLYWDHFDKNGDGQLDVSLTTLNQLIGHIVAKGAFASLSFETYNVGGGGGGRVPFLWASRGMT